MCKPGRPHLNSQPSSRIGVNPPYGMIGGIEETSASCEARSAPRSYPTGGGQPPPVTRWARGNSRPYREPRNHGFELVHRWRLCRSSVCRPARDAALRDCPDDMGEPAAAMSVGYRYTQLLSCYRQTIFPSGCEQNSTFPVQRSSRCTPIDDETICHLKSIANEIAMITVATITVAGTRRLISPICPSRRSVQSQIG